jgi:hypothetical protein
VAEQDSLYHKVIDDLYGQDVDPTDHVDHSSTTAKTSPNSTSTRCPTSNYNTGEHSLYHKVTDDLYGQNVDHVRHIQRVPTMEGTITTSRHYKRIRKE